MGIAGTLGAAGPCAVPASWCLPGPPESEPHSPSGQGHPGEHFYFQGKEKKKYHELAGLLWGHCGGQSQGRMPQKERGHSIIACFSLCSPVGT